MQIIIRIAVALGVSALVYFQAAGSPGAAAPILGGVAFVVLGLMLFLDRIVKIDSEAIFCAAVGVFIGLGAGFLIERAAGSMGVEFGDYATLVHLFGGFLIVDTGMTPRPVALIRPDPAPEPPRPHPPQNGLT